MATKRTPIRRNRIGAEAEYQAWSDVFATGCDFFGDMEPFGFSTDEEAREAAPEAWQRFGARFMAEWTPTEALSRPWALEQFGEP